MCAACGIADHIATPTLAPTSFEAPRDQVVRFAALRHPDFRMYFGGTMLSMMADNIEHVISYWVLYQTFHSPMLAGFAVISHWLPALFLSVYVGALSDRFDCRKIIQISQLLFMAVSAAWGVLFLTNSLQVWHAVALLVIHGLASCLWFPPEQLLLHDMVGKAQLPSAVRLNSTARSLGLLAGPAVGSVLLLGLGPAWGIFANVLIYVPLSVWLLFVPYTGHLRDAAQGAVRRPRLSLFDALRVLREVGGNPALISMVALGGLGSLFIGSAVQPQMPEFAADLGAGNAGLAYGALLAANAAGAVAGGVLLEVSGVLKPNPRTAIVSTVVWAACMIGFAASGSYALALLLLVAAGAANLASQSISQTVVQLLAPSEARGRVVGVYNMAAQGLRAGGGVTVGVVGSFIGIHWSLGFSSAALLLAVLGLMTWCRQPSAVSRQPALIADN
jgi:MFS family permease